MSKCRGNDTKTSAKAETTAVTATATPKLSTPETAMANIGEHYFHAATEKAPAGQYKNTLTPVVDYVYGKGYKEAAKSMDAGEEVALFIPKAPVKEDVVLEEVATEGKRTTMSFDAMSLFDEEDDDSTSGADDMKTVSEETTA